MKSKSYLIKFLSISIALVLVHLAIVFFELLPVNFLQILKLDIIVFILFAGGSLLIAPGLEKDPDIFVNRFLILTTFQLLAMLAILAAMAYSKLPDFRHISFHTLSVFVLLLGVQSALLVRFVNKSK